MSAITWQNFGMAAGVLAAIYLVCQSLPNIIKAVKSSTTVPKCADDEFKTLLQNNTQALQALQQFLEVQAEVDKVKEDQLHKQIDAIEGKVDSLAGTVATHVTKCESLCRPN